MFHSWSSSCGSSINKPTNDSLISAKQNKLPGGARCSVTLRKNSSLSTYIVVHEQAHFICASVTVTCVKWAPGPCQRCPSPRRGGDTCPRSAVPATLDRTWLINRPVLIAGTPLRGGRRGSQSPESLAGVPTANHEANVMAFAKIATR